MGPYSASARQVMLGMGLSPRKLTKKRVAKRPAKRTATKLVRTSRSVKSSADIRESADLPAAPASRTSKK